MGSPEYFRLKNGLRVVFLPFKDVGSVFSILIGRAGSVYEENDEIGVAHMLEHMVFNGTEKYIDQKTINLLIENVGGHANAGTGYETVEYEVTTFISFSISCSFNN